MKAYALTVIPIVLATSAFGQTAPATPATPNTATGNHGCTKPELPDGTKKISEGRMKIFIAGLETYKDCISDFAKRQQAMAEQQQKAASAAIEAANGAIKDYNQFVEEANKVTAPVDERVRDQDLPKAKSNEPRISPRETIPSAPVVPKK